MTRFPPRKILVPFDFSSLSAAAWRQAAALAKVFPASLEAVHVRGRVLPAELAPLPPEERRASGADGKILARIRETTGADARITLAGGDPVDAILRLARARRADLIVMGTHGRTGLKRAVLGSVTEAVVRRSPVPVLAVRGEVSSVRGVLAPVNFTGRSYYGFAYAAALAAALDAPLTALHVHIDPIWNGDPDRKLAALVESLPAPLRRTCRTLVESGQAEASRGILKAATKQDLVVLVAREKSPIKDLILGTTAERVLRGSPASVLLVPAPRRPLPAREDLPSACCATP